MQWDHPRLRGEYLVILNTKSCALGSPPLTRGIRLSRPYLYFHPGITPAYAGNTALYPRLYGWGEDHPRLRGEYLLLLRLPLGCGGSPPLTRGIHSVDDGQQQPHGITPAYAGNTIVPGCFAVFRWDHPRLRGEYQVESDDRRTIQGSPPLTRGILSITMVPSACPRITPAYAGNTVCIDCIFRSIEDHPRLRGEYRISSHFVPSVLGSPPLTRGIRVDSTIRKPLLRITPAYAGNTTAR